MVEAAVGTCNPYGRSSSRVEAHRQRVRRPRQRRCRTAPRRARSGRPGNVRICDKLEKSTESRGANITARHMT
jgi:hypothetical protein